MVVNWKGIKVSYKSRILQYVKHKIDIFLQIFPTVWVHVYSRLNVIPLFAVDSDDVSFIKHTEKRTALYRTITICAIVWCTICHLWRFCEINLLQICLLDNFDGMIVRMASYCQTVFGPVLISAHFRTSCFGRVEIVTLIICSILNHSSPNLGWHVVCDNKFITLWSSSITSWSRVMALQLCKIGKSAW